MQGMIAKTVSGGNPGSEYDSWTDLEENFAMAYEPIPLDIQMDTWRKMTKNDILKTIRFDQRFHANWLSKLDIYYSTY